jgi:hyperosmotically inducible protein
MKTKLAMSLVVIGSLLAPAAGYTSDYTGPTPPPKSSSSPKEFVKDSIITSKIKAKMAKDKQVSAMHIKVDTDKAGVVQLSGTAKSQAEVDRAVAIAHEVEGVTSVDNKIEIK